MAWWEGVEESRLLIAPGTLSLFSALLCPAPIDGFLSVFSASIIVFSYWVFLVWLLRFRFACVVSHFWLFIKAFSVHMTCKVIGQPVGIPGFSHSIVHKKSKKFLFNNFIGNQLLGFADLGIK